MSHQATTWVMEFSESHLSDRLVMGAIAHRISNDDGDAWPSIATIARESRLSERQVYDSIQSLISMGELVVRDELSERGTNRYHFPKFIVWMNSMHPEQRASCNPRRRPLNIVQNTPAQNSPEPSVEPSGQPSAAPAPRGALMKTCRKCQEQYLGHHDCPGKVRSFQRVSGSSRHVEPRRDFAAERKADRAREVAEQDQEILADLPTVRRGGRR